MGEMGDNCKPDGQTRRSGVMAASIPCPLSSVRSNRSVHEPVGSVGRRVAASHQLPLENLVRHAVAGRAAAAASPRGGTSKRIRRRCHRNPAEHVERGGGQQRLRGHPLLLAPQRRRQRPREPAPRAGPVRLPQQDHADLLDACEPDQGGSARRHWNGYGGSCAATQQERCFPVCVFWRFPPVVGWREHAPRSC